MSLTDWVWLVVGAWLVLMFPLAVLVGRMSRKDDEE